MTFHIEIIAPPEEERHNSFCIKHDLSQSNFTINNFYILKVNKRINCVKTGLKYEFDLSCFSNNRFLIFYEPNSKWSNFEFIVLLLEVCNMC